jgi:signal peptidase I
VRRVAALTALSVAGVLALALLALVLLLATGTLKGYTIPTSTMEPALRCARPAPGCTGDANDRVFVLTRFVSYERGDIVVFDPPPIARKRCRLGGTFVKRIVGLPGEQVEIRIADGKQYVYVDDERLPEPYIQNERRSRSLEGVGVLLGNEYFVLGDDRARSCDSSVWGPLPSDNLKGKLVATLWPPGRITIR